MNEIIIVTEMEAALEEKINQALISPEVDGVCVVDKNGFCISSRGTLSAEAAPMYRQILVLSAKLEPGKQNPSVTLISDQNEKIFIQETNGVTVALSIKN